MQLKLSRRFLCAFFIQLKSFPALWTVNWVKMYRKRRLESGNRETGDRAACRLAAYWRNGEWTVNSEHWTANTVNSHYPLLLHSGWLLAVTWCGAELVARYSLLALIPTLGAFQLMKPPMRIPFVEMV